MRFKTALCSPNSLKNNAISALLVAAFIAGTSVQAWAESDKKTDTSAESDKTVEVSEPVVGLGSYLSGRFARMNGDTPSALRYLQDVNKQQPDNLVVASQLRDAYLQEGRLDDAMSVASHMHQISDEELFSNLMLTLKAVKDGDFVSAGLFLGNAGPQAEGQLWLPLVSGWVDVGQKRLKKPIMLEELSANVGRAETVVNYHLGLINAAAGFTDAAAENFARAVENPANPPERVMGAILRFNKQHNSPKALRNLIQSYERTHAAYQADEAIVIDAPTDGIAEVLFTMSSVMMAGDMAYDAVIYLQLALYMKPEFPVASLLLGEAYSQLKDYEKSSQQYAKIMPSNPFYNKTQQRLANNLDQMGKTNQALELLDRVAHDNPKVADALMAKGDMLRQRKRFGEAAEVYTKALERAGESDFSRWALYFARGVCYERIGKWNLAERDLEQALKINPYQPDVLNYLAYGWLERGERISQARVMLDKALRARPNDPQILDSMGWVLYMSGNYVEAADYIEKALEMLPSDAEVNEHLGDVYWRIGRKNEARFQWDRAQIFNTDKKDIERIQQKLKSGLSAIKVAETVDKKPL